MSQLQQGQEEEMKNMKNIVTSLSSVMPIFRVKFEKNYSKDFRSTLMALESLIFPSSSAVPLGMNQMKPTDVSISMNVIAMKDYIKRVNLDVCCRFFSFFINQQSQLT